MHEDQSELRFAAEETLTGYRLRRLEVLNWGTFDRRVWMTLPAKNVSLS
jgi:uncharacterized protein YPO0396